MNQVNTLFKLTDIEVGGSGYQSFVFTTTVKDLIERATPSNIQRMRNEQKEKSISKFIDRKLSNDEVPFFQPFILHYTGDVISGNDKYLLDGEYNIEVECIENDNVVIQKFVFEVLDGNGRLNSMIHLRNEYIDDIEKLIKYKDNKDLSEAKRKKIQRHISSIKSKKQSLENFKLVIQLYVNLSENQKKELFLAVNQGEKMNKGRLTLYNTDKFEGTMLEDYIRHTEKNNVGFVVSADGKGVGRVVDGKYELPSTKIMQAIRAIISFNKRNNIDYDEYKKVIFEILDTFCIDTLEYYFNNKETLDKLEKIMLVTEEGNATSLYTTKENTQILKNILKEDDDLGSVLNKYKNIVVNNIELNN